MLFKYLKKRHREKVINAKIIIQHVCSKYGYKKGTGKDAFIGQGAPVLSIN